MAIAFNDLSLILFEADTFRPQSLTATGAGVAVDVRSAGTNLLNARLTVGAVNTLTTFDVKMQASIDGTNFDDISGATFSTVTAANAHQVISFQLPEATSATALPYIYVRAYGTLVGTAVLVQCEVLACKRMPNPTSGYSATPPTIN